MPRRPAEAPLSPEVLERITVRMLEEAMDARHSDESFYLAGQTITREEIARESGRA